MASLDAAFYRPLFSLLFDPMVVVSRLGYAAPNDYRGRVEKSGGTSDRLAVTPQPTAQPMILRRGKIQTRIC
jgi:hypothetical protein